MQNASGTEDMVRHELLMLTVEAWLRRVPAPEIPL